MNVTEARNIVRSIHPRAACCQLYSGGWWIYAYAQFGAPEVCVPITHGLSKGEAWKHAAQTLKNKEGKQ